MESERAFHAPRHVNWRKQSLDEYPLKIKGIVSKMTFIATRRDNQRKQTIDNYKDIKRNALMDSNRVYIAIYHGNTTVQFQLLATTWKRSTRSRTVDCNRASVAIHRDNKTKRSPYIYTDLRKKNDCRQYEPLLDTVATEQPSFSAVWNNMDRGESKATEGDFVTT